MNAHRTISNTSYDSPVIGWGLSYSTSRFSMKSSKDTPFGLRGVKPNPFSKESQSQRDSKQIVQPWPLSHYFLKWFFFLVWEQVLLWGPVSFGVTTNTWNLFFSGVAWHLNGDVISDLLYRMWPALCSDKIQFLSPKQAKMEKCCETVFLDYTFTLKLFFFLWFLISQEVESI